jgi:hypothetical protein
MVPQHAPGHHRLYADADADADGLIVDVGRPLRLSYSRPAPSYLAAASGAAASNLCLLGTHFQLWRVRAFNRVYRWVLLSGDVEMGDG